jgi:multidrug efflux pump subunit AcrA (membrane-fusion protein)
MKNNPLVLAAQANAAYIQYQAAQKGVELAQAALEVVKAGPRKEDVAVALAQVHQAEAALGVLQTQMDKMTLRSPIDGLVTGRMIHEGEMAAPGVTLLTVANLEEVKLTVYIPEDEFGKVKVGQRVEVTVDSYADKIFEGWVSYVASQAEFTPKNVQTKKERVNMVFAVKVKLPNPNHDLKPGMPADATIYLEEKLVTPIPTPALTPTPTATPFAPTPTASVEVAQATFPTPTVVYFRPAPTVTRPTPQPTPIPGREPSSPPTTPELEGQMAYSVLNRNYRPEPRYDVYVIDVDGSGRRLLASGMRQPDLRGDGWLVANGEGLPDQESLFMVDVHSGEKRQVSANANDVRPRWSPDGNRLLFTNTARNEMTIQDGPSRDASHHILHFDAVYLPGKYPTWLNEGQVVYNGCSNWTYDGKCGLYIAEIRGRMRPLRLTDDPTDIAPAARGTRVVFMSHRDGNWELYAVNTDGRDLTRLTQDQAADGLPVWIGDKALGFLSNRGGAWAVWAMRPEGGQPWKLFDLNGEMGEDWPDEQLSWGP